MVNRLCSVFAQRFIVGIATLIIGMALYSSQRTSRPTFRSMSQVIAAEYRVLVEAEHQGQAKRVLTEAKEA